jgi:hypothetical protein
MIGNRPRLHPPRRLRSRKPPGRRLRRTTPRLTAIRNLDPPLRNKARFDTREKIHRRRRRRLEARDRGRVCEEGCGQVWTPRYLC